MPNSTPYPLEDALSFVERRDNGRYDFWHVHVTGDDRVNFYIAKAYALEYIQYLKTHIDIDIFPSILRSMPTEPGYLEEVFLHTIAEFIRSNAIALTDFFYARFEGDL